MLSKKILSIPLITLFILASASPALADWTIDLDPPTCSIVFGSNPPLFPIIVTANDSSGISLINLYQTTATIDASTNPFQSSTSNPFNYPSWDGTGITTFKAAATDGAGNTNLSSPCTNTFTNGSAYIKTTGGDVHSNTNINTPGGP